MNRNIFLTSVFLFGLASSVKGGISGHVHDSEDGVSGKNIPVKIYRKPTGSIDTLFTTTNGNGRYLEFESNFNPSANPGDSLWILAYNGSHTANLKSIAGTNYNLGITLDNPNNPSKAFTLCIGDPDNMKWIHDTSGVPGLLNGIYWLNKNPTQKCTTEVDTTWTNYYYVGNLNLEEQDSPCSHNDAGMVYLEKYIADTTFRTHIAFIIDTTWLGAQLISPEVYFPLEKIITDQTPPTITNVTEWPDTSYLGPYPVQATITDASGIDSAWLIWRFNSATPESSNADSIEGDIYHFTIPEVAAPTFVEYKIKATDASENQNVGYWPTSGWYSFNITSPGVSEDIDTKVGMNDLRVKQNIGLSFEFYCDSYKGIKKELRIYNVAGSLVKRIYSNKGKCGSGFDFSCTFA